MKLPPRRLHPKGELILGENTDNLPPIEVDTFDGKVRVEWDPDASVSPLGQLPFFIQFLKIPNGGCLSDVCRSDIVV